MRTILRTAVLAFCLATVTAEAFEQQPVAAAIIGRFAKGPVGSPVQVSLGEFRDLYGTATPTDWPAELQARRYFAQGVLKLNVIRVNPDGPLSTALFGDPAAMTGLYALPLVRDFGILLCPEITLLPTAEIKPALAIWKAELSKRRAMMIIDPPPGMTTPTLMAQWVTQNIPPGSKELVLYYPYLTASINGTPATFGASGQMAAAWLTNDIEPDQWIWGAPAGNQLPLVATSMSPVLNNNTSTIVTDVYVCVIRQFTTGGPIIPYSARHLDGGNPENRYIPIQRTTDWIKTNIERMGTLSDNRLNDSTLWTELVTTAQTFLQYVDQNGGFPGNTPAESFYVRCSLGQTMTQADINAHVVKMEVGIALLQPSEFTILQFQWNTRNPARPLEAPQLLMREGFTGKQIFYKTPPGATYTLTSSPTLGGWTQYAAPLPGDDTWRKAAFVPEPGKKFFRVEQTPLP
ncbi:hypothetical protein [Luteolibacter sp. Populi]|uniref:hypothetical protein n=1 Tax=Luteolibacter sp. Populi TaxID=3230487 RepID=UPI003465269F